jgi:hypothetical protein
MVAESPPSTSPQHPPGYADAPGPERYPRTIARGAAGIEGGRGHAALVPLVFHEAFKPRRRLTRAQATELAVKQTALRLAAGLEFRSFRELARELGCTHTAIHNRFQIICEAIGVHKYLVSEEHRRRLRAARARQRQG